MSEVQRFATPLAGTEIEMVKIDGESLFSVPSLARALGYVRTSEAMKHLPKKHIRKTPNRRLGRSEGGHATPFTTEAGLYRLILRSNMPKAEEFTDWVTEELLPAVREAQMVGIDVVEELRRKTVEQQQIIDKQNQQLITEAMDYEDQLEEIRLDKYGKTLVRHTNGRLGIITTAEALEKHRLKVASKGHPG